MRKFEPKPAFIEKMNSLLLDEKDRERYWGIIKTRPPTSIRCNTLKISPEKLMKRLREKYGWEIKQPFKEYPEIMVMQNILGPGEIGKSIEHLLGYYYVQGVESMMPIIALNVNEEDSLLDLCASPGSKTTQAAMYMKNQGSIIANDNKLHRMMILSANLEKNGVSNTIITLKEGTNLCSQLKQQGKEFSKILVDTPCSGEGTARSDSKTLLIWNHKLTKGFSRKQKILLENAFNILKENGELVYSTCTHAPEENEGVIQYLIDRYKNAKIQEINLPIKTRRGLIEYKDRRYSKEIEKCARIYPQDNNTDGFFICKIKKIGKE